MAVNVTVQTAQKDLYRILGVPTRDAIEEDIKRTYWRLARRNHPDVNSDPGVQERFKEVTEAYSVLSDPEKRKAYDDLRFRLIADRLFSNEAEPSSKAQAAPGFDPRRARH